MERCGDYLALNPETLQLFRLDRRSYRALREPAGPKQEWVRAYYSRAIQPAPREPDPPGRSSPFCLCLILTHDCNLNCAYCYDRANRTRSGPAPLSRSAIVTSLEKRLRTHGEMVVWFFGGEPLLRFDTIREVVAWCEAQPGSIEFTITTNGTLLSREVLEYLVRHRFSLLISADGGSRPVPALADALVAYGGHPEKIAVRSTFTAERLPELTDVFWRFRDMGVRRVFLAPAVDEAAPMGPEESAAWCEQLTRLAHQMVERGDWDNVLGYPHLAAMLQNLETRSGRPGSCRMGVALSALDTDGVEYPCHRFAAARLDAVPGVREPNPRCLQCWARRLCGASICAYINHAWTHSVAEPAPALCSIERHLAELACWVYARMRT